MTTSRSIIISYINMTTEDINMTLYKPLEVLNSHTMMQCTGTMNTQVHVEIDA